MADYRCTMVWTTISSCFDLTIIVAPFQNLNIMVDICEHVRRSNIVKMKQTRLLKIRMEKYKKNDC